MNTDLPNPRTPEAEQARSQFLEAYQANLRRAQGIALNVLVWGSSPSRATDVAKKRREIRDRLLELGHNAMFSEDIPALATDLSDKTLEFAQALTADQVLILIEDSPGALAEFHDFCEHPVIAPKLYLCVPERYKSGYSAQGAIRDFEELYGGVFWYSEGDLLACDVSRKTERRIDALRQITFRRSL